MMELVQCIKSVYAKVMHDSIEIEKAQRLFTEGNVYPVFKDELDNWLTTDDDGEQHIIAAEVKYIADDYWFQDHFRRL